MRLTTFQQDDRLGEIVTATRPLNRFRAARARRLLKDRRPSN
jgi:hypothetical protein